MSTTPDSIVASNHWVGGAEIPTGINEKKWSGHLTVSTSQSPLLNEVEVDRLFSAYFKPTGEYSIPIDAARDTSKVEGLEFIGTPLLRDEGARNAKRKRDRTNLDPKEARQHRFDQVNDDRLTLLARKYVAKEQVSDEQIARLEILTERVRQMLPAVTIQEYEALEDVLLLVNRVTETDQAIRADIGLLSK